MNTGKATSIESAGSVLKRMVPDLVVSKQKLRQAEGNYLVRMKRDDNNQTLAFSSRPFVLCGLPVRRPPQGDLLFKRRNGSFVLQITGHPEFGLPFGQDRLVPIYLATLAVQQKSQTVRFRSGAETLRKPFRDKNRAYDRAVRIGKYIAVRTKPSARRTLRMGGER